MSDSLKDIARRLERIERKLGIGVTCPECHSERVRVDTFANLVGAVVRSCMCQQCSHRWTLAG